MDDGSRLKCAEQNSDDRDNRIPTEMPSVPVGSKLFSFIDREREREREKKIKSAIAAMSRGEILSPVQAKQIALIGPGVALRSQDKEKTNRPGIGWQGPFHAIVT